MKQSVKRLASSILALLLIVGAGTTFLSFIQPRYAAISALKGKVLGQAQLVATQEGVMKEVQKLLDTYNQSEALRTSVSAALPAVPALAEALGELHSLAALHRISAQAYGLSLPAPIVAESARRTPDRPSAGGLIRPVNQVVFQMRISATYADFKAFLSTLENNLRIMDVQSINLLPPALPQVGRPSEMFQYDLAIATYYQETK